MTNKIPHYRLLLVTFIAFSALIFMNVINIDNYLIDRNGFRQTQTAISSYYFSFQDLKFEYLAPVIGYPWSVPFEFPIFQLMATAISELFGITLDISGKILNLVFFSINLIISFLICQKLNINTKIYFISLLIYLSMPNSIFWAGTFMIEYLALCLTLLSIYSFILFIRANNLKNWIFLTLVTSLACLQKITTILPVGMVLFIIYLTIMFSKARVDVSFSSRQFLGLFSSASISLGIYTVWLTYTDRVKNLGEFSKYLTSHELTNWNFGSFSLILTQDFWAAFLVKSTLFNTGIIGTIFMVFGVTFVLGKDRLLFYVLLALYILPFIIFKPLHITHDYYQNANLIYLAFALGILVNSIWSVYSKTAITLLSFVILTNYLLFALFFGSQKFAPIYVETSPKLQLAEIIKNSVPLNETFILAGYDWTSEVAYYAERYAIMVPDWTELHVNGRGEILRDILDHPQRFSDRRIGMIILCNQYNHADLVTYVKGLAVAETLSVFDNCSMFEI